MANKNYLNQPDLYYSVINARIKGYITDDVAKMFILLATKCANHRNFVRYYHLKDEIISIGICACCKAFPKVRPYKSKEDSAAWDGKTFIDYDHKVCSNLFAFFTTVIFNDVIHFLSKEYTQSNIVNQKRLDSGLEASYGYSDMIAEKEAQEREDSGIDEGVDSIYENQTLWDESSEDADDALIDWQRTASS